MGFSPDGGYHLDSNGVQRNIVDHWKRMSRETILTPFRNELNDEVISEFITAQGSLTTSKSLITDNAVILSNGIPYLSAAQTVTISSTSANDTIAGSGARTIRVTKLNSEWNRETVDVSMNGQNGVNVTDCIRICNMTVLTVGSNQDTYGDYVSEGIIYCGYGTIINGVPTNVLLAIEQGDVRSRTAVISVPAGYTFYGRRIHFGATADKTLAWEDARREFGSNIWNRSNTNYFKNEEEIGDYIFSIGEKGDFELRAFMTATSTNVHVELDYWLVKNE